MDGPARLLIWAVDETAGFDTAWATLDGGGLRAEGRAAALRPRPYWLTYRLETDAGLATRSVTVEASWEGGATTLELARTDGRWTVDAEPRPDLDEALDCDLAACPLTNTMPIVRHRLHETAGDHTFLMAFIEVPSLRVVRSRQRYTHLRTLSGGGAIVRFRSGSFESDLTIDRDGFVIDYPKLGRRLGPDARSQDPASPVPDPGAPVEH